MSECSSGHGRGHLLRLLIALACVAAACGSKPSTSATVSANTWAVVDGKAITQEDVDKAYRRAQDASQTLSEEEALTAKLSLLDDLIVQEILVAKAGTLKLDVPQSEIDTAYAAAKKDITDEAFQQELTRRNVTVADVREGLRRGLLVQKLLDQEVGSKVVPTDQEITDFFNANREQFNVAEEAYRIAQIVVTPVRDPQVANGMNDDAATPQAAAMKVQVLMERLKGGASFSDLAAGYSEDPESASRRGDMGLVPVSKLAQVPAALRNAVLNKAPGTVTVVSAGGAHTLVLVVGHELAGQRDLSTPGVRENISGMLRARREQLLHAAYLAAIRTDADVVNHRARRLVESKGRLPG